MTSREPQCIRCGHLATVGSTETFLETPCSHLYCSKCVHRLFALQSRIACASCGRALFRHELTASSSSKEDQLFHIVAATRKRVYAVMNKERNDFASTPGYDDFLEQREDLVNKFIQVYDTAGLVSIKTGSPLMSREDLEKVMHKFEVENQEQVITNRSGADEKRRQKIEEIIETEGTLYERINVNYSERDSVIDHELATQYADLLSRGSLKKDKLRLNQHTSADLINRKTRIIQQQTNGAGAVSVASVPIIAQASGCKGIWKQRALESILASFKVV